MRKLSSRRRASTHAYEKARGSLVRSRPDQLGAHDRRRRRTSTPDTGADDAPMTRGNGRAAPSARADKSGSAAADGDVLRWSRARTG